MRHTEKLYLIKLADTKNYVISGSKVQGVGLRKTLHDILDEQSLDGLAVNNPYNGSVEVSLPTANSDAVLQELKQRILKAKNREIAFKENPKAKNKLIPHELDDEQLDKLRQLHFRHYLRSSVFDPSNVNLMSIPEIRGELTERYRLKDNNGKLTGSLPPRAIRQLKGKELPYSFMLPKNLVKSEEDVAETLQAALAKS